MARTSYADSVFINCPFDHHYQGLFDAIVFTTFDCGYVARSALEISDASQVRLEKILNIINSSKFGIHDISRTEVEPKTKYPRFNMALELGLFLAAKRFGVNRQKQKVVIILDKEKFRYQKFISDIAGQDISAHQNKPKNVVTIVRNWLRSSSNRKSIPGGSAIWNVTNNFEVIFR